MLGLRAWGDDLVVVLFEFLEDDTKLAQSCDPLALRAALVHRRSGPCNAQKGVDTRCFLRSAPECQSNVSSNQRGCGSPVKAQAQASARVDVPTARTCVSFCCECLDMCSTGNRPQILSVST